MADHITMENLLRLLIDLLRPIDLHRPIGLHLHPRQNLRLLPL